MEWKQWNGKHFFFLNEGESKAKHKNTFVFASMYHPSKCTDLEKFEKDLFNIVISINFLNYKNILVN